MYSINIVENEVRNPEGFRLIAVTKYHHHPAVKKAELWSNGKRDENGTLTRHNLFRITYRNNCVRVVTWENFSPQYYRSAICISYDGQILFLPDYEKGIVAVDITSNCVFARYKLKHIFSIWATDTSLLCLHKEYNRLLTRLDFRSNTVIEEKKSNGLFIVPVSEHCVLYKGDFQHYIFANPDDLAISVNVTVSELFGCDDDNINILHATLTPNELEVEYHYTDEKNTKKILTSRKRVPCSSELRNFINNQNQ